MYNEIILFYRMNCDGNGDCLIQCECECYNEEKDEYKYVCVCGHRDHEGYCPTNCCSPVQCRNYKLCNKKIPNWIVLCHNGMDINCAIQMGPHKFTTIIEDCCVCFDNKVMIILKCNHKVCNDCWFNITKGFGIRKHVCPLCRNPNRWGN